MEDAARRARAASRALVGASCETKNAALAAFRRHLAARRAEIEEANRQDKEEAEAAVKEGKLSSSLLKRLDISGAKFDTLLTGIDEVVQLPDPVGQVTYANRVSEGLDLYRVTCPIGVGLIIFESRPDAAVQIASLAMKSGNALLLKGGREAQRSNAALAEIDDDPDLDTQDVYPTDDFGEPEKIDILQPVRVPQASPARLVCHQGGGLQDSEV
ncbi:unnamed protein product [Prorocentrum cordatum]|uniref:Glutamate-5-semialdehyde dehydrogenase n=1 Tax=Prorocentrum cordatum TaxID=2364126 RepID=A0ABN9WBS4_9DINO|nr:unnamed protein product [Polarella glacialis]